MSVQPSGSRGLLGSCLLSSCRSLRNPEAGNPRQVRVFHGRVTETLISRMKAKIDTPEGRAI